MTINKNKIMILMMIYDYDQYNDYYECDGQPPPPQPVSDP